MKYHVIKFHLVLQFGNVWFEFGARLGFQNDAANPLFYWLFYSGFDWLRAPSSQHHFEYMLEEINKIQTIVWFLPIHIFYFTTDGRLPYFTQTHYSEKYEQIKILNLFCPAGEIFLHFKLFQKSDLGWWNIGSSKVKKRSNIPGSLDVMFPSGQWSWILISCITPPNTLE